MGTPSLLTTIVPMTPLWLTNLFKVSSTSEAIFIQGFFLLHGRRVIQRRLD